SAKIEWGASDRVEKRFTRRLTRNSLQGFDHELADQIAFNRYKARFCARTNRRKCRLIRRHHWQCLVARKRNNLAHDHASALAAQLLCERIRSNERDRHEHGIKLKLTREPDEFCDWFVRTDRHHGLRLALHNFEQRGLDRSCVALK